MTSSLLPMIYKFIYEDKSYKEIAILTNLSIADIKQTVKNSVNYIFDDIISKLKLFMVELDLSDFQELWSGFHSFYQKVLNNIQKGTQYRNPIKLTPIALYLFMKTNGFDIASKDYYEAAGLSREQFRKGLMCVRNYCPEYINRDKRGIVLRKIINVRTHFSFNSQFTEISECLLEKLWVFIKDTKEEIIAGVICILTMIKLPVHNVKYDIICKKLGVKFGTITNQVKYNLCKSFKIEGFKGFRRTSYLLKPVLD